MNKETIENIESWISLQTIKNQYTVVIHRKDKKEIPLERLTKEIAIEIADEILSLNDENLEGVEIEYASNELVSLQRFWENGKEIIRHTSTMPYWRLHRHD